MRKILVADDEPAIRRLVRAALTRSAQYDVLEASDGVQALYLARTQQPDLAVLDLEMPGLNGYEVCAALKADPATQHIPTLILTGSPLPDVEAYAFSAGANRVLRKPFSPTLLHETVYSLLGA